MKKYIAALLLAGLIPAAQAIDTFNPNNNVLTLDSIVVDGIQYNNVVVILNGYNVLNIGSSAPYVAPSDVAPSAPSSSDTCTADNLTNAKYNVVGIGMTLDQVNQIFGCKYDPLLTYRSPLAIVYTWHAGNRIVNVFFDTLGRYSKDIGGGVIKQAQGF